MKLFTIAAIACALTVGNNTHALDGPIDPADYLQVDCIAYGKFNSDNILLGDLPDYPHLLSGTPATFNWSGSGDDGNASLAFGISSIESSNNIAGYVVTSANATNSEGAQTYAGALQYSILTTGQCYATSAGIYTGNSNVTAPGTEAMSSTAGTNYFFVTAEPISGAGLNVTSRAEEGGSSTAVVFFSIYSQTGTTITGDVNHSGSLDEDDLNFMNAAITTSTYSSDYDLNSDGQVDDNDYSSLLTLMNVPYGDVNLDGTVNWNDINIIDSYITKNNGNAYGGHANGDLNGDLAIDYNDILECINAYYGIKASR